MDCLRGFVSIHREVPVSRIKRRNENAGFVVTSYRVSRIKIIGRRFKEEQVDLSRRLRIVRIVGECVIDRLDSALHSMGLCKSARWPLTKVNTIRSRLNEPESIIHAAPCALPILRVT